MMESVRPDWKMPAVCAVLVALVFLVFGQTWHHGFISYDDGAYVSDNATARGGLTWAGLRHAVAGKDLGLWNPLVAVSHMAACQVFGLNAGGHHLVNVLLHAASVVLLFVVLLQMTGAMWRSALVAALFAIHPLRVESVAWIAERKDVLSGLFFMLTLWAYAGYVRRPAAPGRYAVVVGLFALGLLAKPMLVTLPFVLLLLDYWPLGRLFVPGERGWRRVNWHAVWEKLPMALLSAALCAWILWGAREGIDRNFERVPLSTRLAEAPVSCLAYLGKMFWPANLAIVYPRSDQAALLWPTAVVLLGALSAGFFLLRKDHPYLWMGWLWNLGMLVPASGVVQISRHWMADHYTYLPQIGIYIALAWTLGSWAATSRSRRAAAAGLAAACICALALSAFRYTSAWRDNISLWSHVVACTSNNYIAHSDLGLALVKEGQTEAGFRQFQEALRINPTAAITHYNIGITLFQAGHTQEAIAHFRAALAAWPEYVDARYSLGTVLLQSGHTDEATTAFREVLRVSPNFAGAHTNLGITLAQGGRDDEALLHFREAVRLDATNEEARFNLEAAVAGQTGGGK